MSSSPEDQARRRDSELVTRCLDGDQDAWTALVQRYSAYVFTILTNGFGLDPANAQDVFQEVFTRTFRRLDTLKDPSALKPWIAQLARRAAIDRIRATRPEVDIDSVVERGEFDPDLERIEHAMAVHRALDELPEMYRDVVARFFIHDDSYAAIAEDLGLPHGTIASRISRGLAMLRTALSEPALQRA